MENKLIKMTDFVLEQMKIYNDACYDDDYIASQGLKVLIENYANFLKQPLELWMFVPCDEDGNVLKEPEWMHRYNNGASPFMNMDEIRPCQEYKQAKEICLFEGFESVPLSNSVRKGNYIIDFNYTENSNVESLLHHDIGFELTQTAIKQLSL